MQEGPPFFREITSAMMFALIPNVSLRFLEQRCADAHGRITRLPFKLSGPEVLIAPFRRACLDQLHGLSQWHCRRDGNQDVGVIIEASYCDRIHAVLFCDSRHE